MVSALTGPAMTVQDAAIGGAEVAGDVAALFLSADDAEGGDFLEGGHEVFVEVLADFGIGQGVHTDASALFQVKRGSSKLPDTCSTKTSFCSFLAICAALLGVATNSMVVPCAPQVASGLSLTINSGLAARRPSGRSGHGRFAVQLGAVGQGQPHEGSQTQPGDAEEKTTHNALPPSGESAPERGRAVFVIVY